MITREQVLNAIKELGPTIPVRIKRKIGAENTIYVGAVLSELYSNGAVLISNTKIGSSRFYYLPEQKEMLEEIAEHLNEKDKRTFNLLKKERVLEDEKQTPLVRVSLRNIKDFAVPVRVKIGGEIKLFWKYFLVGEEEAKEKIREMNRERLAEIKRKEELRRIEINREKETEKKTSGKEMGKEKEAEFSKEERTEEESGKIEQEREGREETAGKIGKIREERGKKGEAGQGGKEAKGGAKKYKEGETEKNPLKKEKETMKKEIKSLLYDKFEDYCRENGISIEEKISVKKKEVEAVVKTGTAFGKAEFYCKLKDKKRCNEGDVATAYMEGQARKLGTVFMTTGNIGKKTKEKIKKYKGLVLVENF